MAGDATSNGYILQIFRGLVRMDDNLEPVADIATGWQVSADGRVYTFRLRAAACWSNGEPVLASDFVTAWRRLVEMIVNFQKDMMRKG